MSNEAERKEQTQESPKEAAGAPVETEPKRSSVSEKKKLGNRQNAQHSTGPKTESGKARVRGNALRHGFYAKNETVVRQGAGQEDEHDYQELLKAFERSWQPSDEVQQYYVLMLVDLEWRLRRAVQAEVGEITRSSNSLSSSVIDRYSDEISKTQSKVKFLTNLRDEVQRFGYVSEELQRELNRLFGKDDLLAKKCREFSQFIDKLVEEFMPSGEPEEPEDEMHCGSGAGTGQGENSRAEEAKFDLLFTIQIQTSLFEASLQDLAKALAQEHEAAMLASKLPSREFLDGLIKYETALEKKRERTIKLLLQLKGK